MLAPIKSIPRHILISVLQKMSIRSLARFRQTAKFSDDLVEKNRLRIGCRWKGHSSLAITITKYKYARLVQYLCFEKGRTAEGRRAIERIPITDYYKQLSAFHLGSIQIKIEVRFKHDRKMNDKQQKLLAKKVFPQLKKCRFSCDRLHIQNETNSLLLAEILPFVKFSRLVTLQTEKATEVKALKFKKMDACYIFDLEGFPEYLIAHICHIPKVLVLIESAETLNYLPKFLSSLRTSREVRGSMKYLHLCLKQKKPCVDPKIIYEIDQLFRIPGLECLWRGRRWNDPRQDNVNAYFFKMEIEGGVAIIIYYYDEFHIHFVESVSRLGLFNLLSHYLFESAPCDNSPTWHAFLSADTDRKAFAILPWGFGNPLVWGNHIFF